MNWLINPFVKGDQTAVRNHDKLENLEIKLNQFSTSNSMNKISGKDRIEKMRTIEHKQSLDKLPILIKQSEQEQNKKI